MEVYRGDIFYILKGGQVTGSEQGTGRPAVIVSNDVGNHYSQVVEVVYLTTKEKNPLPTHTEIICNVPSTALCEQITSVAKERLGEFIRSCTTSEMKAIDRALQVSLGLGQIPEPKPEPTSTADKERIEKLTADLEKEKKLVNDLNKEFGALVDERDVLQKDLEAAQECISHLKSEKTEDFVIKLTTERDLYKSLYEQTIDRLVLR